jgi:murein DD-endopeptidase MepM/ murein hydrolase activator NlpD
MGKIRLGRLKPKASFLFLALLLSVFSEACGPRRISPPQKRAQGIYHIVRRGENLFRIGKAYDISYRELARINRIRDPSEIRVGQSVFIPGATRRLPVEIITPENASLERPRTPFRLEKKDGFLWPVAGKITSNFGRRGATFHDGIDIAAPEGTPIRAIESGEVLYSDRLRGYGNLIIIRHLGGFASVYAHNRRNRVREGQKIRRGEIIAEVGSTGRVTGPHLHFEIRKNNITRDPLYYLPRL